MHPVRNGVEDSVLPLLFTVTLFVSATLLFLVQPMIAKMVLPLLGGTPAVWNTCMVFFQAVLLAGYSYAHATTAWLGVRRQLLLHLPLLLVPLVVLPLGIRHGWTPPASANPIPWLLLFLTVSVGLPFFVLSTSAPLLQKWFAATGHPAGRDPYFLYAASNLGSMLALLGYPVLVEPFLPLKPDHWLSQSWLWAAGYGVLAVLVGACAWAVWRAPADAAKKVNAGPQNVKRENFMPPTLRRRVHWVALAFVPSSLMLGVTTYITLDIAAVPLLWIIPLALYLLSFILVFARWPLAVHKSLAVAMPLTILLLIFLMLSEVQPLVTGHILWPLVRLAPVKPHIGVIVLMHLATLFVVSLVCHGELARTRPSPHYLTGFYLLMSLGGVLGGLFNALVAPLVFSGVIEYQLALVAACLLVPAVIPGGGDWLRRFLPERFLQPSILVLDIVSAALVGLFLYGLLTFVSEPAVASTPSDGWLVTVQDWFGSTFAWVCDRFQFDAPKMLCVMLYGIPILLAYTLVARPLRFGLGVGALLLAAAVWNLQGQTEVLHQERTFFGVLKVKNSIVDGRYAHTLLHGTTLHGVQLLDLPPGPAVDLSEWHGRTEYGVQWLDDDSSRQPSSYYHRTGPVGQMFAAFPEEEHKGKVAVIGLGSGTLAAYGQPDMGLTFYDIDPAVVRIAENPDYFTYLKDCPAKHNIILGDARLRLQEAPDSEYDVILVDAFSSDAIPIHLITREALELYFQKLAPHGVLMVHISNRYLDLEPVLGNLARHLKLVALDQYDENTDRDEMPGKNAAEWVVLARTRDDVGSLAGDPRWHQALTDPKVGVWTDDYSNLLAVFEWNK
jgi:hypothetical protein